MQVRTAKIEAIAARLVASGIPADRVFIDQHPKPAISWANRKRNARRFEIRRLLREQRKAGK